MLKPSAVVVVWIIIKTGRLQSLSGGGQVHTPLTGKCLPGRVAPAAHFQSAAAWFEVSLSGQRNFEIWFLTQLHMDWAVLLTNALVPAFTFL